MKKLITLMTLFLLCGALSAADKELLINEPQPKMPQRENSKSEEAEHLMKTGNPSQQGMEDRQVKENQEEIDPIFYDATTSPAELDKAE